MTLHYFVANAATSYKNTSNDYVVVLGIDMGAAITSDGDKIRITNESGKIVDSQIAIHFGTAASEVIVTGKKWLLSPSYTITFPHSAAFHGVTGTLQEVLPFT